MNLPAISAVPEGSVGPWVGVGEQWADFFDVFVGCAQVVDPDGTSRDPTIDERRALYDRLATESLPISAIPNSVVRVDFLWNGMEPKVLGCFSYGPTDFASEFALRQLGSQIVGLLGPPFPDWIEPFLYDADAGVTLAQYKQRPRVSGDGIIRTGEERLQAWEQYVATTVARYRHAVGIWQILNEPVSTIFSVQSFRKSFDYLGVDAERAEPNAERFGELFADLAFELISRASRVIRSLDPTAQISTLGLLDANDVLEEPQSRRLLEGLIDLGLANHVDMVSLHYFPQQWPISESDAETLDWYTAPDFVIELAQGTNLRFMVDEWGHPTRSATEETILPQFLIRLIAQNLAERVSPLLFFEAYGWCVFPRDLAGVQDYYLLTSQHPYVPAFTPSDPESTPGLEAYKYLVRFLSGAVGEDEINRDAPHATLGEYPGYSYRSFTNGLDRIVAFWSNSADVISPVLSTNMPSTAKVLAVTFPWNWDQDPSVHDLSGEAGEGGSMQYHVPSLGWFESGLVYLCPEPEASINITAPDPPVCVGVPVRLDARGPNGERLAPTWRVAPGSGVGVISPDGLFQGFQGGTCTVVADVGIHSASQEIQITDLSENLLANSSLEVVWPSPAPPPPWKTDPPAEMAAQHGVSVGVASGSDAFLGSAFVRLVYSPTIGVDQIQTLIDQWRPGYVSQGIRSGLAVLGQRPFDEPLLFFCWGRRTFQGAESGRYIYIHIALFDRFRNPQDDHKLADVRIGGRFDPGSDWKLISSRDKVGVPYVRPGRDAGEFVTDGFILLPQDVELLEVILEIDNRFESPPTTAEVDAVYFGPYQPFILVHSGGPGDMVQLAWYFDCSLYSTETVPRATVDLYLDLDLQPDSGNEWPVPGGQDLPTVCGQPAQLDVAEIPSEFRDRQLVFAYGVVAGPDIATATDYAGPLLCKPGEPCTIQTWSRY